MCGNASTLYILGGYNQDGYLVPNIEAIDILIEVLDPEVHKINRRRHSLFEEDRIIIK